MMLEEIDLARIRRDGAWDYFQVLNRELRNLKYIAGLYDDPRTRKRVDWHCPIELVRQDIVRVRDRLYSARFAVLTMEGRLINQYRLFLEDREK